jgi:hypothetical protein
MQVNCKLRAKHQICMERHKIKQSWSPPGERIIIDLERLSGLSSIAQSSIGI